MSQCCPQIVTEAADLYGDEGPLFVCRQQYLFMKCQINIMSDNYALLYRHSCLKKIGVIEIHKMSRYATRYGEITSFLERKPSKLLNY